MKRALLYIGIAIAAIGCTKDDTTTITPNAEITFSAGVTTRVDSTNDCAWASGGSDEVGLFTNQEDEENLKFSVAEDNTMTNVSGHTTLLILSEGTRDYYAYHPYVVDDDINEKKLTFDLVTDGCSDPLLWATVTESNAYDVKFQFTHKLPKVTFNLTAGGVDVESLEELDDVTATLKGAYSTATFGIETGTFDTSSASTDDITLTVTNGTAVAYLIPQYLASGSLWITADGNTYIYPLTNVEWESGHEYKYDITVGEESFSDIRLKGDVYYINTDKGLAAFRDLVNGADNTTEAVIAGDNFASFNSFYNKDIKGKLTQDIDLSKICNASGGTSWSPIGNSYTGSFDGGGFEVSNLYINSTTGEQGLFGTINGGATISNLGVSGSVVGKSYVGGLVGYANGSLGSVVSITNCYSDCSVSASDRDSDSVGSNNYYFGGVVGYAKYTNVTSCYNKGGVIASDNNYVGGVVGYSSYSTLSNCYNTGGVNGNSYVGGVVGDNTNSSKVENCYSTGSVKGSSGQVGGVAGWNTGSSTISNCYNMGDVKGSSYVGGVVGQNSNSSNVENCYSAGSVGGESIYIGGVVGQNGSTVSYCFYDTSTVDGSDDESYTAPQYAVGGSTTNNDTADDTATNYYCGLGNAKMKDDANTDGNLLYYLTYSGYGDSSEWRDDTDPNINSDYPILKWQVPND
ncbi:MAG: fimbrillin family protein [Rikenellaceae bacterium]